MVDAALYLLLPTREEIDATSYEKGQTVSLLRRFFAWGIDWLVIGFVQGLLVFGLNFIPAYKIGQPIIRFSDRMWFFIMVFAVFIVMMKLTNGQTLGKKLFAFGWLKQDMKNSFKSLVCSLRLFVFCVWFN